MIPCTGFDESQLYPGTEDATWGMARLEGRRRAWQAAISPGEAHAAVDPGMPEWGNPPDLKGLADTSSDVSANPLKGNI